MYFVQTVHLLRQEQYEYKLTFSTFKLKSGKFWCTLGQKPYLFRGKKGLIELGNILYHVALRYENTKLNNTGKTIHYYSDNTVLFCLDSLLTFKAKAFSKNLCTL